MVSGEVQRKTRVMSVQGKDGLEGDVGIKAASCSSSSSWVVSEPFLVTHQGEFAETCNFLADKCSFQ